MPGGVRAGREAQPQELTPVNAHTRKSTMPIDNAWGPSYIPHGATTAPPSSGHLRFPMLWAHLKVPHRRLPRASARREAAYLSQTLPNA